MSHWIYEEIVYRYDLRCTKGNLTGIPVGSSDKKASEIKISLYGMADFLFYLYFGRLKSKKKQRVWRISFFEALSLSSGLLEKETQIPAGY